jgi:tRNA-splicing ligase RtcB (3'-phosphate/5'-hydroxy nucleic acid ligase)
MNANTANGHTMNQITKNYNTLHVENGVPVKAWTQGVALEDAAREQLENTARLPIVFSHVAVMPDVHYGIGATIGSVVPTLRAIIPAAVGVDIGCGMIACKTSLRAEDLPDSLAVLRSEIEKAVPHGSAPKQRRQFGSNREVGAWSTPPTEADVAWAALKDEFDAICLDYPSLKNTNNHRHMGTLGGGNHFVEICLDTEGAVWIMLHSGSRGVGGAMGQLFINLAKKDAELHQRNLPDKDLAYLEEGSQYFADYVRGVSWAQRFAKANREVMMGRTIGALKKVVAKPFETHLEAINCHHNYVQKETHFGQEVYVTRKGAVSAKVGELGIIPGSMGAKSFIVRGKGNPESFNSCSHGAGRSMSRTKAKKLFTVEDQIRATEGVECRKDAEVIDEIPMAYKDIDAVMAAQSDLVEVVYTLKQIVCVKG